MPRVPLAAGPSMIANAIDYGGRRGMRCVLFRQGFASFWRCISLPSCKLRMPCHPATEPLPLAPRRSTSLSTADKQRLEAAQARLG